MEQMHILTHSYGLLIAVFAPHTVNDLLSASEIEPVTDVDPNSLDADLQKSRFPLGWGILQMVKDCTLDFFLFNVVFKHFSVA